MRTKAAVLYTMQLPSPYAESRSLNIENVELRVPGPGEIVGTGKPVHDWTTGKGGSGPRPRRTERSGYVGPFDHSEKDLASFPSRRRGERSTAMK